jgi:phthiocerol/phenolphthiocerol synthesis type-I polyketide synthase E
MSTEDVEPIAVVGLGGRFPGARGIDEFWRNMRDGVESVTRFSAEELLASGVDPALLDDPDYVPAAGVVEGADEFDAAFFGYSPREAEITDPQQRVFLETAWETFEDAGHDPAALSGAVGVFAGCFMNKYYPLNLLTNSGFLASPHAQLARVFNDKDFLATRVAYLLDLRGPAYTVQSACSTGLVAVHVACQSLWAYECDAALAGGVCINVPIKAGYPTIDGGMFTPDGHCRPFDARAAGTVPGYGAATVLLRRLSEAVADRDNIRAIIRGTAVNNDGSLKVSYAAPSVDAQAEVVMAAHAVAGVAADTLGYVEAHGTGTKVGDPIEVAALTQAFRESTDRRGFCALGSVKANIGHLDAAAGTAGLIRAVLAVEHGEIPPNANFEQPNPELRLHESPFYVPTAAMPWHTNGRPRRAGVTSLGVGGTNAHVVVEQAPPSDPPGHPRSWQLLPLSARTPAALHNMGGRLADHLDTHPDQRLADVAFTLQTGRHRFDERRFVVARDHADAAARLRKPVRPRLAGRPGSGAAHVVFTFPGGGAQYLDMGLEIYDEEPVVRAEVDLCAELLAEHLGIDLRRYLFPSRFDGPTLDQSDVRHALASIFVVEHALATLWQSWGVRPHAMIGHSLGEYAAACTAGVFSLADALAITVLRGEIFARAPEGRMLSVSLGEADILPLLGDALSLAAVNAPGLTLVSGPGAAIAELAAVLDAEDVEHRLVPINLASHSHLMDPYLDEFRKRVAELTLRPPEVPFLSGVTGTWIRPEEATDPDYWTRHLRQPVRFSDAVGQACAGPNRVLLEVGPGTALTTLASAQRIAPAPVAVASMRHPQEPASDMETLLTAAGKLWQADVPIDLGALHAGSTPRRVPLPTYSFERKRYWVAAGHRRAADDHTAGPAVEEDQSPPALDDPGYLPPTTEREGQLAGMWSELLGINRVGIEDDFFELGGNSLAVSQLLKRLRRAFSVSLSIRDLFAAPTIAALAAVIDARMTGRTVAAGQDLDLAREASLPAEITAVGMAPPRPGAPRAVLLTGGTGFLGPFLAAELLARTDATVHCLLRASDAEAGLRRIHNRLAESGLADVDLSRIVAVPGDLAKPLLGLGTADFDRLAQHLDAIYHCGAWVNFVRPYQTLKPTNVTGTQEVLRLAARHRIKPVHHVSTLAVQAGAFTAGADVVYEDAELPPPIGHDTGYSQSKWVAEQVVAIARAREIPVSVYRPGVVLADSRTGVANSEDYITKVIQGCIQLGLAPLRDYPLAVGAVDHVAQTIVDLSLAQPAESRNYHTVDPQLLPWNRMFDHVRSAGFAVRSVPYDEWHPALVASVDRGEPNALALLVDSLRGPADRHTSRIDCTNVCAGTGIMPPALDERYFTTMLRYFTRCGWAPAMSTIGAAR